MTGEISGLLYGDENDFISFLYDNKAFSVTIILLISLSKIRRQKIIYDFCSHFIFFKVSEQKYCLVILSYTLNV